MPTNPHITHQRACNALRELIAAYQPAAYAGKHDAAYIIARLREALRDLEASELAWRAEEEKIAMLQAQLADKAQESAEECKR